MCSNAFSLRSAGWKLQPPSLEKSNRTAAAHVEIGAQSLPIHVLANPGFVICIVATLSLTLDRGMRGHCKGDHDVDLVRLHLLRDAPAARRFDSDRATDGEPDIRVGIGQNVLPTDQFKQILRDGREISRGLREFLKPYPGAGQPLRCGLHLIRIEQHLAETKMLTQLEQRAFDRGLKIERLIGRRLKHTVRDQAYLLPRFVKRRRNDGRAIVFDRGVDADPDRQTRIVRGMAKARIDAPVPGSHVDE